MGSVGGSHLDIHLNLALLLSLDTNLNLVFILRYLNTHHSPTFLIQYLSKSHNSHLHHNLP